TGRLRRASHLPVPVPPPVPDRAAARRRGVKLVKTKSGTGRGTGTGKVPLWALASPVGAGSIAGWSSAEGSAMPFAVYVQDLNPLGFRPLSTLVAALPVLVLFYLLVGRRWLASWAGAAGAVTAVLLASLVYGMPPEMAGWSFVHGMVF